MFAYFQNSRALDSIPVRATNLQNFLFPNWLPIEALSRFGDVAESMTFEGEPVDLGWLEETTHPDGATRFVETRFQDCNGRVARLWLQEMPQRLQMPTARRGSTWSRKNDTQFFCTCLV